MPIPLSLATLSAVGMITRGAISVNEVGIRMAPGILKYPKKIFDGWTLYEEIRNNPEDRMGQYLMNIVHNCT